MKLDMTGQERAAGFMRSKARPLERACHAFHFGNAGRDPVLNALATYQNADGGFGRGLEPDLTLPDSSALCTTRARASGRRRRFSHRPNCLDRKHQRHQAGAFQQMPPALLILPHG